MEVKDLMPWESLDYVIKEYFNSDKKAFYQWVFSNYELLAAHDFRGYSDKANWEQVLIEAPYLSDEFFSLVVSPKLDSLQQVETKESYNELKKLKAQLVRDTEYYRIFPDTENTISFVTFNGKKYLIHTWHILETIVYKIDALIDYYENSFPEWLQGNHTKDTATVHGKNDQYPPEKENAQHGTPEAVNDTGKDMANVFDGVKWKGNKTDLAELITGLWKIQVIQKNDKLITKKDLQELFQKLFNIEISNIDTVLKKRLESFKSVDNKLFIDDLSKQMDTIYKNMATDLRKQKRTDSN